MTSFNKSAIEEEPFRGQEAFVDKAVKQNKTV